MATRAGYLRVYIRTVSRVRFAPSPTGTLHVGNALSAVANREFGDHLLLRIDDTDPARNVPGGEQAIEEDLRWLGVAWDEGPVRQSDRAERHVQAWRDAGLPERFMDVQLVRTDGTPTYQLASVVDDLDFGITHVLRGSDHRPNEELQRALHARLGHEPPEYLYHGLILGPDGHKLSKREQGATVASLRDAGYPTEAVRGYLSELGRPRHDVHLDLARIESLAVDLLAALSDEDLAERAGIPVAAAPLARGAHDLAEARALALTVLDPPPAVSAPPEEARLTLERFAELRARWPERLDKDSARAILRELKAVGGNLRMLRVALTGRDHGPELWAVLHALPRDEALRRVGLP
jgi:glutamyl/glutaminyl-tRNA synthetase